MRRQLLLILLTFMSINIGAQNQTSQNGWFGSVGGGINFYVGEHDKYASFSQRIAPAMDLSIGKWVSPKWGIRGQYAGIMAKGVFNGQTGFTTPEMIDGRYVEDFHVMSLHADALFNFSNWVGGDNSDRFYQMIPFAGLGWAISWTENAAHTTPTFNAGLINQFRLSPSVNLNLEMRGMAVSEDFEGTTGGRWQEGMASLTLGITYKFGKPTGKSIGGATVIDYQAEEDTVEADKDVVIAEMQKELDNKNRLIKQLYKDLDAERAKLQDSSYMANAIANEKAAKAERTSLAIFFPIGATLLDGQDIINLGYLADKIKASSNKFTITGYADAGTGSANRNKYLSDKRAQNVYKVLVDKYKVNPEQLEIVAKGGVDNMFESEEFNRVVLIENK